jgi:DNA-binding transcriptional regulator/RsmH inhibitor MraZ
LVWEQNEKLFENPGEVAPQAKRMSFLAKHYGGDSEVDAQGRILVPQVLRKKLQMEDQPVWLGHDKGAIEIYGEAVYQAKLTEYETEVMEDLEVLQKKGLK